MKWTGYLKREVPRSCQRVDLVARDATQSCSAVGSQSELQVGKVGKPQRAPAQGALSNYAMLKPKITPQPAEGEE
jgi:hypothetical protein